MKSTKEKRPVVARKVEPVVRCGDYEMHKMCGDIVLTKMRGFRCQEYASIPDDIFFDMAKRLKRILTSNPMGQTRRDDVAKLEE